VQAGLPAARAEDFVIAVSEIAAYAVRYGSPAARLLLVAGGAGRGPRQRVLAAGCGSGLR
jgi:hypothetical protein